MFHNNSHTNTDYYHLLTSILGDEELWIDQPGAIDLITQADIPQWLKDGINDTSCII